MGDKIEYSYPSRAEMCEQWESLTKKIYGNKDQLSNDPDVTKSNKDGSLTIIGSGIESLGFSMNDVKLLEEADEVFYCVADPATIVWLKKIRPKAYDLYTLYDDTKVRYHTYMQMTEAMLYYVRQGKKVVAVYYGHPGIFVLSTHRAIAIAKREGLQAQMRANVSALDCLCADIGVDPSYPGMVTYEATDMLIRLREPDTSLHCILWQVGLIGEMGYRRSGFINNNFVILIEYLQKFYGDDFEIIHYIASKYPTIPPRIEKYTLHQLKDPRIRKGITGISTFYIPPKVAKQTDLDMCIRLGLAKPGQTMRTSNVLRDIDKYNKREMDAVEAFKNFAVPEQYHYQKNTPVSEFLIELAHDAKLQELYKKDPENAIKDFKSFKFNQKERDALISRSGRSIQIAAKQLKLRSSAQERLVIKLLSNQTLAKETLEIIRKYKKTKELLKELDTLALQAGNKAQWKNIPGAITNVYSNMLLPWTGIYGDTNSKNSIVILGNKYGNRKSRVFINTIEIKNFSFNNYTLIWLKEEGNMNNGSIRFNTSNDNNDSYIRTIEGKIWSNAEPKTTNIQGTEFVIDREYKSHEPNFSGEYIIKLNTPEKDIYPMIYKDNSLIWNGSKIEYQKKSKNLIQIHIDNSSFMRGELHFLPDHFTGLSTVFGHLFLTKEQEKPITCYGMKKQDSAPKTGLPGIPDWILDHVNEVNHNYQDEGGLMIYNQYAKMRFTSRVVSQVLKHINTLILN